ncbi:MAG TPA: trehalose-phosphatase [Anaerolineaceae bacterium]|jgi:trehalose-phosphatase
MFTIPDLPLAGNDLAERLASEAHLYLFLDYDGTLAPFAPNPDVVIPDGDLIRLVERLIGTPGVRTAVVSGRRLEHILKLLPIRGLIAAGTYGLEIHGPDGEIWIRAGLEGFQAYILRLKPTWEGLLAHRPGFYLEDKTWSLAIHARFASQKASAEVFSSAQTIAFDQDMPDGMHFQGGDRFLEVSPSAADKGLAVAEILQRFPLKEARPVYLGDDDKDEIAFATIERLGGVSIVVTPVSRPTNAGFRLADPQSVRGWLTDLIKRRQV